MNTTVKMKTKRSAQIKLMNAHQELGGRKKNKNKADSLWLKNNNLGHDIKTGIFSYPLESVSQNILLNHQHTTY